MLGAHITGQRAFFSVQREKIFGKPSENLIAPHPDPGITLRLASAIHAGWFGIIVDLWVSEAPKQVIQRPKEVSRNARYRRRRKKDRILRIVNTPAAWKEKA
jgi:hypothetical protein